MTRRGARPQIGETEFMDQVVGFARLHQKNDGLVKFLGGVAVPSPSA